jgi:putative HD superfamily hydrolase of NAD metabolism
MITEAELDKIRGVIPYYTGQKRLAHVLSVEEECASLAKLYVMDEDDTLRLRAAALLHDITKKFSHPEQLDYCRINGIAFTEEETHMPKIFHARTGAHLAKKLFPNLVDIDIYNAILYHTTARPSMTLMEALLYLADYIEPKREFVDCVKLRGEFYELLENNDKTDALKKALILSFDMTLTGLIADGAFIHGDIITARNYYLEISGEVENHK